MDAQGPNGAVERVGDPKIGEALFQRLLEMQQTRQSNSLVSQRHDHPRTLPLLFLYSMEHA